MAREIDYGTLMHQAMRGLIQRVLEDVAANGLPADHHFYITFDTRHPDVDIADWLRARYPEEMTIVMQHYFEHLSVDDEGFTVTLNFGDSPEPLRIPFDALLTFVDPSVEFGLRFEPQIEDDEDFEEDDEAETEGGSVQPFAPTTGSDERAAAEREPGAPREAEVVSLDRFRKSH